VVFGTPIYLSGPACWSIPYRPLAAAVDYRAFGSFNIDRSLSCSPDPRPFFLFLIFLLFDRDDDFQSIRNLIAAWMNATVMGDLPKLLTMMDEDVVFLIAGQPPMRGREAFAATFRAGLQQYRIDPTVKIQEIQLSGGLAYCWNHLSILVTPLQGGSLQRRTGHTLTVLRKNPDGRWVVFRDANLLSADPPR
jgi:uncharacterized protein (TIGR02246 family)